MGGFGYRMLRQQIGDGHADLRCRSVQLSFGGAHIRTPLDQLRRHAERQIRWQYQMIQLETGGLEIRRQMAGEYRQLIARLVQLFVQGRQRAFQLSKRCILGINVGLRDSPKLELAAQHRKRFPLKRNHMLSAGNLSPETRFLDGCRHDIRGQREIRGVELEAARLSLCSERLHSSTVGPEHVGHIRDRDLGREQVVQSGSVRQGGRQYSDGIAIAAGIELALHRREIRTTLRRRVFHRLAERRLRRRHVGIGPQCIVH